VSARQSYSTHSFGALYVDPDFCKISLSGKKVANMAGDAATWFNGPPWSTAWAWLGTLDWTKIISVLVVPACGLIFVWWKGGFSWVLGQYNYYAGLRAYRKALRKSLRSLAVIGKREGFDLEKVYVHINVNRSDLMRSAASENSMSIRNEPRLFVLVGGPGAGKSTYVKKLALDNVIAGKMTFFVRLREYDSNQKIEDLLVKQLETHNIGNSLQIVHRALLNWSSLCILDGLDEVRPHLIAGLVANINSFQRTFFQSEVNSRLVVTCRKEAYRSVPLDIPEILEVIPLKDDQIREFAKNWPLGYPQNKSANGFWSDIAASPKILEVSRSPLLLVGSLLLYTESNLGIPGERVRYLERIKQTLVEDWATAQGLPPDPRRIAYGSVLARVALEMHLAQTAEFTKTECLRVLEAELPNFGFEADTAAEFLDQLSLRTGILVRDVPNHVIFVQFALQEYFASLCMPNKYGPEELASLKPKTWWRESILFAIAQTSTPTTYIEALSIDSPMLAATAVAEIPTPSLQLQEMATGLVLRQLDLSDDTSALPIVSLLRKVSPRIERELCNALALRIERSGRVSELAGGILAAAGTADATNILSKYPAAWGACLNNATFLSNNFELLLRSWIAESSNSNWKDAAHLLLYKQEAYESFSNILNFLKRIPKDRANYIAEIMLIEYHKNMETIRHSGFHNFIVMFSCFGYITDPADTLTKVFSQIIEARREAGRITNLDLIPTLLALCSSDNFESSSAPISLFQLVRELRFWCVSRRKILLVATSCIPVLSILF
jgi:NACHT domain